MEEYKDLDLTIAVFQQLLDDPEFLGYSAGIVLQAYLPDALGAMIGLQEWSAARRARGGAPIKVRLVKGANLPMERVEASLHDWPLATWHTKAETDANYKRVLDYALTPERIDAVQARRRRAQPLRRRPRLAARRAIAACATASTSRCCSGWPPARPRRCGGTSAACSSTRRSCTRASSTSRSPTSSAGSRRGRATTTSCRRCSTSPTREDLFERERQRFLASLTLLDDEVPAAASRAARRPARTPLGDPFGNAVDTDPSVAEHREWAQGRSTRARRTRGSACETLEAHTVTEPDALDALLEAAPGRRARPGAPGPRPSAPRCCSARATRSSGAAAELVEVMMSEAGKTIDQADPEVSEAIDFARWYAAQRARARGRGRRPVHAGAR